MLGIPPRWRAALLLATWLTAVGPLHAADESASPSETAAPAKPGAEDPPSKIKGGSPPPVKPREDDKTSEQTKTKPRPLKTFRPSEEIHVDKAVDFPADI